VQYIHNQLILTTVPGTLHVGFNQSYLYLSMNFERSEDKAIFLL
jgi:hypothetical protein